MSPERRVVDNSEFSYRLLLSLSLALAKPNNKNYGQSQNIYVAVCFTGKGCSMPKLPRLPGNALKVELGGGVYGPTNYFVTPNLI
jgi:hypothetical protein